MRRDIGGKSGISGLLMALGDALWRILTKRRFWLLLATIALLWLVYGSPWRGRFTGAALAGQLESLGNWAIAWFVAVYVLLTVAGVPGVPLTVAGGLAFGFAWGAIGSVVGATLGAIAAFWITRYLMRDWAERKFGRHRALIRFNRAIAKNPLQFVLAVRLAPIFPFNLANFLFGLTPVGLKPYAIGTFFGIIPGTLTYTWLGIAGSRALRGGDRWSFILSAIVVLGFFLFPLVFRKRWF